MLLEVGRVLRAHGLKGEVVVRFITDRPERRQAGATFESVHGMLEIETAKSLPSGDVLVAFIGVRDRGAAEGLAGTVLTAEPIDDPEELWVHELIGSTVVDQHGVDRGRVAEVHDGPASDLLVLEDGHLIPVTFVVSHESGRITVDVPDGIFDL